MVTHNNRRPGESHRCRCASRACVVACGLKGSKTGLIQVNGQSVPPSHVLRNGEQVTNIAHRHEPPVTAEPVRILHRDDVRGLLVVEKPGSMPVHPTGRYNYNTLLSILKFDYGLPLVHSAFSLNELRSRH